MTLHSDIFDQAKRNYGAREQQREKRRQILLAALAKDDKNGCFTDEDRAAEGYPKLSKDDAWELICEMAFEDEWTDEDWDHFGLDHPGDEEVYRVVAEAAEAEVNRLARLICGGERRHRHGYMKEMGRATRKLDKIEDREGLWI